MSWGDDLLRQKLEQGFWFIQKRWWPKGPSSLWFLKPYSCFELLLSLCKGCKSKIGPFTLEARKLVCRVRLKPTCSATETSYSLKIWDLESIGIVQSRQRTIKVLIRLRVSTGWSAPLLFAYGIKEVFSWHGLLYDVSKHTLSLFRTNFRTDFQCAHWFFSPKIWLFSCAHTEKFMQCKISLGTDFQLTWAEGSQGELIV